MRSRLRRWCVGLAFTLAALAMLDFAFPPPIDRAEEASVLVVDREGRPLRAMPIAGGHWRFTADLDRIDPDFVDALLAVEDKRFYRHWGVDVWAVLRATGSMLRHGEVVSGASTITMQTARLLEPRPRNIGSKLVEMVRAVQIERRLSKREILELYLTLTPYGGNLEGVEAASWAWFGRSPDRLSRDQIALLIALPQAPEARRPDRRPEVARAGRADVARKLVAVGAYTERDFQEIDNSALPRRHAFPARAWHAADNVRRAAPGESYVRSTLDAALQADVEALLARRAADLPEDVQLAAIVVDISTRSVRALAGSAARDRPGGWIDLTRAARSPGSTLKPFIYALAFDDGIAAPGTQIVDLPTRFAAYQPENFDRSFRGDVTVAEALQHSLNVPAVMALERVGPVRFAAELTHSGAPPRIRADAGNGAGLALALGGAGLTLQELAVLYASLGDGGVARPLNWLDTDEMPDSASHRLMSADSAEAILDILRKAPTPAGRTPGRLLVDAPDIAFKTGTSYGYRDAWAAGVVDGLAIIVWVGRADGAPRTGETGRKAALPVLFDLADRAALRLRRADGGSQRVLGTRRPQIGAGQVSFSRENAPPQILFPPNDAELWAGLVDGEPARPFVLAGRGAGALQWYVDGQPCPVDAAGLPIWAPTQAGFYRVSAVDRDGRTSHVRVRVRTEPSG